MWMALVMVYIDIYVERYVLPVGQVDRGDFWKLDYYRDNGDEMLEETFSFYGLYREY